MTYYNVTASRNDGVTTLECGFGEPADNDKIAPAAAAAAAAAIIGKTGGLCLVNGRASLPAAFAICHAIAHVFQAIGVFDPKLNGFVITITHSPQYTVGEVVTA